MKQMTEDRPAAPGDSQDANQKSRILIVDDERDIIDTLADALSRFEFTAVGAASLGEARVAFAAGDIDAVLLDLSLADEDGLEFLREVRRDSNVPILIVSGRDDPVDKVLGLEVGADDYISKPFHPREVVARLRTVLRRGQHVPASENNAAARARFAGWLFDPARQTLDREDDGRTVKLTTAEMRLMTIFAERANQPLTRDDLAELAFNRKWNPLDRSIDVHIGNLRRKIEDDPGEPELIRTVHGTGYVMTGTVKWD